MKDDGAAAVELAIVLPILLLFVFGLLQIILILNTQIILEHAAYEAVRVGVVGSPQNADGAARRVISGVPRGVGFLGSRPMVRLVKQGEDVRADIRAEIILLPFFRQASIVGGGDGVVELDVGAVGKAEPYVGR